MNNFNFYAYQGDTKTLTIQVSNSDGPVDLTGKTIRAQLKREKDGEVLAELGAEVSGNVLMLNFDGTKTEKIDLIGDRETLYYDAYADDKVVVYGTVKMMKGVSCHGHQNES